MNTNINIENKPVTFEQTKPVLKVVTPGVEAIKAEDNNISSIEMAKENKKAEESKEPEQTLDDAVKQLNSYVQSINRNLEFNIDNDSGKTVVKVFDSETEQLIRQIPNEEALSMTKQLADSLISESGESGLLLTKLQA